MRVFPHQIRIQTGMGITGKFRKTVLITREGHKLLCAGTYKGRCASLQVPCIPSPLTPRLAVPLTTVRPQGPPSPAVFQSGQELWLPFLPPPAADHSDEEEWGFSCTATEGALSTCGSMQWAMDKLICAHLYSSLLYIPKKRPAAQVLRQNHTETEYIR